MAAPKLSEDVLREAVALYEKHGRNASAAAFAAGIATPSFTHRLKQATLRGLNLDHKPAMPGFEISKVTTDPNGGQHITQKPEHGDVFEMPPTHFLGKMTVQRDAEGRVVQDWIRALPDADARAAAFQAVVDALKEELPRIAPTKGPDHANEQLLNQYTITDLHMGMLAWAEENRTADWDLKIAERLLLDWFSAAIAMAPNAAVGLFAQLGDLMHHDALESVTPTHKHVLDADSRLQKVIRVVIRVVRQIIGMMLEKYPRVHLIFADANHDPASSAWMRELLHAMYENEPRITVDCSPDTYYVYEWGRTALFYHHGHKRKISDVDSVFAGKFREIYGRSRKSYGHLGHLHNDEVKESNLMKIERHRTLAAPDAYANGGGWLSDRDAKVITYHRQFGEVGRVILSPEMVASVTEET